LAETGRFSPIACAIMHAKALRAMGAALRLHCKRILRAIEAINFSVFNGPRPARLAAGGCFTPEIYAILNENQSVRRDAL